jgi:hypothetical protein
LKLAVTLFLLLVVATVLSRDDWAKGRIPRAFRHLLSKAGV